MIGRSRLAVKNLMKGPLVALLGSLGVGIAFCALMALALDAGPFDLLITIWDGAWGSTDAAASTLSKVTPILLTGLAVSIAYRAGLLNIGCEGQLTLGALSSASISIAASSLPPFILLPLTVFTGAAVGGLWALPAIWLRQKRGIHEVICTLLLNYIAIYLADYLALGPLGDGTPMGRTPTMPAGAVWPAFWRLGALGLTAAPFLAFVLTIAAHIWLSRTVWGYEVNAIGSNIAAARAAGISVDAWRRRLFVASGALAGLAGALEVSAVHHRFYRAFSPGYGFDGITVAFLVNAVPGCLSLSALLLASLRSADKWLQLALGASPSAILVIQAVLLLSVVCRQGFQSARLKLIRKKQ